MNARGDIIVKRINEGLSKSKIGVIILDVLEIILNYDNLFNICLWGLIDGVKSIKEDSEYSNYIQRFVYRLEKGNRKDILNLCEKIRMLAKANQDSSVRKRALELFNYFHKKGL